MNDNGLSAADVRAVTDASNGWYYDPDATNTEEAKLFCYKKGIVD